ncbi:MAG: aminoglycoside 6-adenylyltransferase [Bacillota bacterium]|nr:aminoglycoside 6-adenylyltransferase [Bacillota bacterium]
MPEHGAAGRAAAPVPAPAPAPAITERITARLEGRAVRPGETCWVRHIREATAADAAGPGPVVAPGRVLDALTLFDALLDFATADERVRLVWMNGSRVDPAAPRDAWMDFDIVYGVTDFAALTAPDNCGWIDAFGPRVIEQLPDAAAPGEPAPAGRFAWLLQFANGQRVDLTVYDLLRDGEAGVAARASAGLGGDSLTALLVDKDGLVSEPPTPHDGDYRVAPPTAWTWRASCNEFWWVTVYVAKALARSDWWYAADLIGNVLRAELLRQLTWRLVLERNDESFNPGKAHTRLYRLLSSEDRQLVWQTASLGSPAAVYDAFAAVLDAFRSVSQQLARLAGYEYPDFDRDVSAFLPGYIDAGRFWSR